MSVFATFAAASFYLGLVGQSSCGCFGRLSLNPWYTFGIDLGIIVVLFLGRPDLSPLWERPRESLASVFVPVSIGLGGIVLISVLLLGLAFLTFGSVAAASAFFRGERISVQPRLLDVGEGTPGEQRTVIVELTNWTGNPIQLIGGTADCKCTVLNDLPLTIPAKETRAVSVDISFSGKTGIFSSKAVFLVDDGGLRPVSVRLTGRILPPKEVLPASSGGS